jgi:hypothetical protein
MASAWGNSGDVSDVDGILSSAQATLREDGYSYNEREKQALWHEPATYDFADDDLLGDGSW